MDFTEGGSGTGRHLHAVPDLPPVSPRPPIDLTPPPTAPAEENIPSLVPPRGVHRISLSPVPGESGLGDSDTIGWHLALGGLRAVGTHDVAITPGNPDGPPDTLLSISGDNNGTQDGDTPSESTSDGQPEKRDPQTRPQLYVVRNQETAPAAGGGDGPKEPPHEPPIPGAEANGPEDRDTRLIRDLHLEMGGTLVYRAGEATTMATPRFDIEAERTHQEVEAPTGFAVAQVGAVLSASISEESVVVTLYHDQQGMGAVLRLTPDAQSAAPDAAQPSPPELVAQLFETAPELRSPNTDVFIFMGSRATTNEQQLSGTLSPQQQVVQELLDRLSTPEQSPLYFHVAPQGQVHVTLDTVSGTIDSTDATGEEHYHGPPFVDEVPTRAYEATPTGGSLYMMRNADYAVPIAEAARDIPDVSPGHATAIESFAARVTAEYRAGPQHADAADRATQFDTYVRSLPPRVALGIVQYLIRTNDPLLGEFVRGGTDTVPLRSLLQARLEAVVQSFGKDAAKLSSADLDAMRKKGELEAQIERLVGVLGNLRAIRRKGAR